MSWKVIKRYMDFLGLNCFNPRSCFKEAFSQGIIEKEDIWLDMIEMRNISSHTYDEFEIKEILIKIKKYIKSYINLENYIKNKLI